MGREKTMTMYERFTGRSRESFQSFEELQREYNITCGEHFNYAFDVLDVLAEEQPQNLAMLWVSKHNEERRFTFDDMRKLSNQTANFLRNVGVKKGDAVMLVLKRGYQFWYTLLALHKIGAIAVPAPHLLTAKDYVYRLNAAQIAMIIATGEDDVTHHVQDALPQCPSVRWLSVTGGNAQGDWLDFDGQVQLCSETFERPTGSDANKSTETSLMFFSSGTTGYPKMVCHDYTYPLGHIMTGCFWHRVQKGGLHFTISDTGWGKSLWGKIYGQWLGESAVFTYDFDRFDAADILGKVEKYEVTTFCAPPTMYRYMIKEDVKRYNFSKLTHCTTAGEALNPEVYYRWEELTGLKIFEGFGQTETTLSCLTVYPWMEPKVGSMGLPAPGYKMFICNENGEGVAPGTTGEICIKTDESKPFGLFQHYFNAPEQTLETWHDGLYHTGDTAYTDEMGYVWYVGRVDDVIKSSGYRIGPFEVESVLMENPAVLEVAVTGAPDADRGFVVKATVVLAKGYTPSPQLTLELQNHVKRNTAPYKYPRIIEYVEELPKTINGKIRRADIRERDGASQ